MAIQLNTIEFDTIKTNLKTWLQNQDEFTDYNFEASGLSLILDLISYLIHYLTFYLNTSVNESFLSTAIIRKNINSIVKSLNYIPRRKTGATAIITIVLKTEFIPVDTDTVITINTYTTFSSSSYNFFSTNSYQLTALNNYTFEIEIKQGTIKEETFTSDGTANQEITIENDDVDNDIFNVYVNDELWTNENNLTEIDETSETYQLELTDSNYVKIIFGDNILGKIPGSGYEIKVIYSETVGEDSNNLTTFILSQILEDNKTGIYDNSNFTITTTEQSTGGAEYETIESIKLNAPNFYASQNRLITVNDYIAYLQQHQLVKSAFVWGGDEEIKQKYGYIYITIKPESGENLNTYEKSIIEDYLSEKNILTMNVDLIDVDYIYIDLTGSIYYYQQYELELNEVRETVNTTITDFFNNIEDFNDVFKMAKLITDINNLDEIANTNITISPYFTFEKISTGNYFFDLENIIIEGSVDCDIVTGSLNEGFYDDENGNLITKKDNSTVIGEIDYTTGEMEIYIGYEITNTSLSEYEVYFNTENDDIYYKKQKSLKLNEMTFTYVRSS